MRMTTSTAARHRHHGHPLHGVWERLFWAVYGWAPLAFGWVRDYIPIYTFRPWPTPDTDEEDEHVRSLEQRCPDPRTRLPGGGISSMPGIASSGGPLPWGELRRVFPLSVGRHSAGGVMSGPHDEKR